MEFSTFLKMAKNCGRNFRSIN